MAAVDALDPRAHPRCGNGCRHGSGMRPSGRLAEPRYRLGVSRVLLTPTESIFSRE